MKSARLISITILLIAATVAMGQTTESRQQSATKSLAERLGYPADAKLLIVHGDDLGMAHSINTASLKALDSGLVSSASIMIPCPWLLEIAAYAREHPTADLGLHLTLTSEWKLYRWGPLLSKERVPSLIDASGYLYPTESEAAARIDSKEAEAEVRAQIARARAVGIQPTHLDSHMGTLYQSEALFGVLLKVARENRLPIRVSREMVSSSAFVSSLITPEDVVIDHIITIGPDVSAEGWSQYYTDAIKKLSPGVTEFVIHLAFDDQEMQGIAFEHPNWGAEWRGRDFQFFTSDAFRKLLEANNVKLITWREVGKLLRKN